jgi:hypothetical protein
MTLVNQNEANDLCKPDPDGTTECEGPDAKKAVELNESARLTDAVSTAMLIGGSVAVAAGVVLYFTAPRAGKSTTALLGGGRGRATSGVRLTF